VKAVLRIRKEPYYRRAAFEQGLKRVGFTLTEQASPTSAEDWLVIWNRQGAHEIEADAWEAKGGTVIVAENGYLQKVDKTHYAISVHGHNGSGWFPVDQTEDRFSRLGFELKPWRGREGIVLICGQRGIGSRRMKSPPGWAEKQLAFWKHVKGTTARIRPHPGNFAPKVPLALDLRGVACCSIWSSAAGVFALIEGVPVVHHAPHWVCAGASESNRVEVLNRMAHGQWHHEEIATGEPFARIIHNRKEASW
jgi:hypothetical protein